MNDAVKTVHYFTNLAPHYRRRLWEEMAMDKEIEFEFYFGRSHTGIKEINFSTDFWKQHQAKIHRLKNRYLFGRIVWQNGVLRKVIAGDIDSAMFLGDMNLVSNWLAAIILRLKGKEVSFWGHGLSGDESFVKKQFRVLFNRLADQHFIYNERSKNLMVQNGINRERVHVIYNSLDYDKHVQLRETVTESEQVKNQFSQPERPLLVFIGRLTKAKKLHLLIRAVQKLNVDHYFCNLLIIGDGTEKENLMKLAEELIEKKQCKFSGACYDEKKIGQMLANSDLCVSPGNVGLTAIHCMSFGTPVCTHDNFGNQMPEFEAIEPGITGFFFRENDEKDLAIKIKQWFKKLKDERVVRESCFEVIDKKYNPYHQISVFKKVLLKEFEND